MTKKKATSNESSPSHAYKHDDNTSLCVAKNEQPISVGGGHVGCIRVGIVSDAVGHVLQIPNAIPQYIELSCYCTSEKHIVDIATIIENLRDDGYKIVADPGALIPGTKGMRQRTYFLHTDSLTHNRSATND